MLNGLFGYIITPFFESVNPLGEMLKCKYILTPLSVGHLPSPKEMGDRWERFFDESLDNVWVGHGGFKSFSLGEGFRMRTVFPATLSGKSLSLPPVQNE